MSIIQVTQEHLWNDDFCVYLVDEEIIWCISCIYVGSQIQTIVMSIEGMRHVVVFVFVRFNCGLTPCCRYGRWCIAAAGAVAPREAMVKTL